jgi:hypothetical protein
MFAVDKSGNGQGGGTTDVRYRGKIEALGPAVKTWTVTKSDTVNFDQMATEIYCGTGGTVACVMEDGNVQSFTVPDGGRIAAHVKRVNNTGTSAALMVASI